MCNYLIFFVLFLPIFAYGEGPSAPALGQELSPEQVRSLDTIIGPSGSGLPPGAGNAAAGAALFDRRCQSCHGRAGRGGQGGELAGGHADLTRASPDQNVGTYWPYATTLFDFVRRAMPMDAPWSLTDDQVYAVTAYILHLNDLLDATAELNAEVLARLRMPNRGGFIGIEADPQLSRHQR